MGPSRFGFHPVLLAVIGVASGALALGASTLGWRAEDASARGAQEAARRLAQPSSALQAPAEKAANAPPAPSGAAAAAAARRPRWFPALFAPDADPGGRSLDLTDPLTRDPTAAERAALIPAIANNQILAFYGKPDSRRMGILGEYPKEDLAGILDGYARLYDGQNGERGVVSAFYLIYGTCWPEGEIGYLKDSVVQEYIDFARSKGMLVFVDHQIGKYPVADAMARLLPWLKYPNVHLALDPEWRTDAPMKVI